jgi:hypothetical protein
MYSSIAEIKDDISISVDFNEVFGFGVSHDGDCLRQRRAKFQIQSNRSLTSQIHVIVLGEIRSQVVRVQSVSVGLIRPAYVVSFVPIYLVCAVKQSGVGRYTSSSGIIQLERFQTVQLTVEINTDFRQRKMFKVECISLSISVSRSIVDQTHHQSDR